MFEKGTVNFSEVTGEFDAKFAKEIPGTEEHNGYYATGTSVILHPMNPWVPAMHFNTRYLKTSTKEWFGGGMDVTPSKIDKTEKKEFHKILKIIFWPLIMLKNILDHNWWTEKIINKTKLDEKVEQSKFVAWKNKLPQPYKLIFEICIFVVIVYIAEIWFNMLGVSMLPWKWDWSW